MPKIKFVCAYCGKECEKYDTQASKYCSPECYHAARSKHKFDKVCPICTSSFRGALGQIYCSEACKRKRDHEHEKQQFVTICPNCGKQRTRRCAPYQQRNTLCRQCASIRGKQTNPPPNREKSHSWKGGRRVDQYGYIKIHAPGHPFADSTNYVREHLYVVTEAYGEDFVRSNGGIVHHINGNKRDNRLENLVVCTVEQNAKDNRELLDIAFMLVQVGVIEFVDRKYCCPLLGNEAGEAAQIR
jgi:hypothetical protein